MKLEWKLEMSQRDMELQVARAKEQAQMDHWKKLGACDEFIALLKKKVQQLRRTPEVVESSLGSRCIPNPPEKVPESGGIVRITLP